MKTGQEALVLFYAFFWAAALSSTARYKPFDTPSMWKLDGQACKRFVVSLIVLNVLPITWFIFLYSTIASAAEGWRPIMAAAVASLSAFGFHRILHAVMASEGTYKLFYTEAQIKEVRSQAPFDQPQSF